MTTFCGSQGADLLVLAEYAIIKFWSRKLLAKYTAELPSVDDLVVTCDDPGQHEVRGENRTTLTSKPEQSVIFHGTFWGYEVGTKSVGSFSI